MMGGIDRILYSVARRLRTPKPHHLDKFRLQVDAAFCTLSILLLGVNPGESKSAKERIAYPMSNRDELTPHVLQTKFAYP